MRSNEEARAGRVVLGRRLRQGEIAPSDFTYTVVEANIPEPARWDGQDRRVGKRVRSRLREAVIGERKSRPLVDCRITNRSKSGARLRLVEDWPLPQSFVLSDGASCCCFYAVLVWQIGADAGVKLVAIV